MRPRATAQRAAAVKRSTTSAKAQGTRARQAVVENVRTAVDRAWTSEPAKDARAGVAATQRVAERAVFLPLGVTLVATDRAGDAVQYVTETVTSPQNIERELRQRRQSAEAQVKRFERRGEKAVNDARKEARRTRNRVERRVTRRARTVERDVERRADVVSSRAELRAREAEHAVQTGLTTAQRAAADATEPLGS